MPEDRRRSLLTAARWILGATTLLLLVGLAIVVWVMTPNLYPIEIDQNADSAVNATREATRLQAIVVTRTSILAALAGIGAFISIAINYANSRTSAATLRETARAYRKIESDRSLELAQREQQAADVAADAKERRITDLYINAVNQLGSDRSVVRLGGLYALERLAQTVPEQRQTIVNVICAYLRLPYFVSEIPLQAPEAPLVDENEKDTLDEQQVRSAAQDILVNHLRGVDYDTYWGRLDINLSGATLTAFSFDECSVGNAYFMGSRFQQLTRFRNATFAGVCSFAGAHFVGWATFDATRFKKLTTFSRAKFEGSVGFCSATFGGKADFGGAEFSDTVELISTQFMDSANFDRSKFERIVRFGGAVIGGLFNFAPLWVAEHVSFAEIANDEDSTCPNRLAHAKARCMPSIFQGEVRFGGCLGSENVDSANEINNKVILQGAWARDGIKHSLPRNWRISTHGISDENCLLKIEHVGMNP